MTTRTAILTLAAMVGVSCASAQQLPERAQILKTATLVNNYFMKKYADSMSLQVRVDKALSGAMGDVAYIARFRTDQGKNDFLWDTCERV